MNNIHFEQIICASSQKSITTGSPGFGVRTKSPGIPDIEADELFTKSGINYRLPMDQMATEETLEANPDIEELYPSLYTMRSVQLNNGETRYIIARTLYVGLDYGYFAQMQGARRAGANYVAHLLVFKEQPSAAAMAAAIRFGQFMPATTRCSVDNEELCSLLVGEPTPLPDGDIAADNEVTLTTGTAIGWMTIALLQAYKDCKTLPAGTQKKILFKVNHNEVESLLCALGSLPEELTGGLSLQANTMLTSSVPDGLDMLIINEKNDQPTDDEYHITVDLIGGGDAKTFNIEDNYIYEQIMECCRNSDTDTLLKTIRLFLGLDFSGQPDYQFAYRLMLLASTDKELTIEQLDDDTLRKIAAARLDAADERAVWQKVNDAINGVFAVPCHANDIRKALASVDLLQRESPHHMAVSTGSCDFILALLFNKGDVFNKILGEDTARLHGALYMLKRATGNLPDEETFYEALNTSAQPECWTAFIQLYYGNQLKPYINNVVARIARSPIADKATLAAQLYPVEQYTGEWLSLLSGDAALAAVFGSLLADHFTRQMSMRPNETMRQLLDMSPDVRKAFAPERLAALHVEAISRRPADVERTIIMDILASLQLSAALSSKYERLLAIISEKPMKTVDTETMTTAVSLSKNKEYLFLLFGTWLTNMPAKGDVTKFAHSFCTDSKSTVRLLDCIWKEMPKKQRTEYVLAVTDSMSWQRFSLEKVVSDLKDKELKNTIVSQSTFMKKLLRKFTSLFTGSNKK